MVISIVENHLEMMFIHASNLTLVNDDVSKKNLPWGDVADDSMSMLYESESYV